MATFIDLLTIVAQSDPFRQKVRVACIIAAEAVRTEATNTDHAVRLAWAKRVFANPEAEGDMMLNAVIAQNAGYTTAIILGATDAAILAAVTNAIPVFAS